MKDNNLIITFANQKGGVGKSTLCAMFATYVSSLGYPVRVVDCDGQTTIALIRKKELSTSDGEEAPAAEPYAIDVHQLKDPQSTQAMIASLVNFEGVVMIDAPGNLKEAGLVPIFANSDFIICPFTLDKISIVSTATFVVLINRLRATIGEVFKTRTIFVPNRVDGRVGTAAEKKNISATKLHLSHYGDISPEIGLRACMQRVSTLTLSEEQTEVSGEAFRFLASALGLSALKAAQEAFTTTNEAEEESHE
ncbi:MAG: ParA family protein [Candidatus Amulumruptor caecigallinarius]|nr:ParA family protein [Candidatus Amulumruptor caecigallinarius]MCM1397341.1 ParA family protein [Candidatus Amulumruptor caecigallinarius]MCM1453596.1 ParA family protein [bacterium]